MKRSKEKITLSILLAAVLVVSIVGYMIYVQHQFYTESTKNLLETYEQVDKTFTMFRPAELERAERVGQQPAG